MGERAQQLFNEGRLFLAKTGRNNLRGLWKCRSGRKGFFNHGCLQYDWATQYESWTFEVEEGTDSDAIKKHVGKVAVSTLCSNPVCRDHCRKGTHGQRRGPTPVGQKCESKYPTGI